MSPTTLNPRRMTGVEAMFLRTDRGAAYQHTLKIHVPPTPASDTQTATTNRPTAFRRAVWGLRDLPPTLRQLTPGLRALRERIRLERQFAVRGGHDRPSGADRRQHKSVICDL